MPIIVPGGSASGQTLDDFTSILTGMFDASSSTVQGWVNEAYRKAVSDAKWLVETASLFSTVAGQASYDIPTDTVQLDSLFVNGVEYGRVGEFDIPDLNAANEYLSRAGGVFAQTFSSGGTDQVALYPTPTQSGLAVTGRGVFVPANLATGSGPDSVPVFPADLHSLVLDGAISIGYLRADERPDLSAVHEQRFADGVQKLRARRIARVRGRGPFQARIAGRN